MEFGDQRIYASHRSIMFSRRSCYFFVRPKRSFLEVCIFLARSLKTPQVRRVDRASTSKFAHFVPVTHRDQVEPPITEWLREAYDLAGAAQTKTEGAPQAAARASEPAAAKAAGTPKPLRGRKA